MNFRKMSLLFAALFLVSGHSQVLAKSDNSDLGYTVPSLIQEDFKKGDISKNRESYPEGEKKADKKSASSVGIFYVGYAYPAKASSKDRYKSVVKLKKIKRVATFSKALKLMNEEFEKFKKEKETSKAEGMCIWNRSEKIIAMKKGRAYATPSDATMSIGSSYITKGHELYYYGAKGYTPTQSKALVGISSLKAYVSSSNLTLVPKAVINGTHKSASSKKKKYNLGYYYKSKDGNLMHRYYTLTDSDRKKNFEKKEYATSSVSFTVDKAPSFMKKDVKYYSMDGHDFFSTSTLSKKAGVHYPYFKYLPYRTKSQYSKAKFNAQMKSYPKKSVLKGSGAYLIKAQNTWGINALLELSFADLESAYGTSYFAVKRHNLFGIAAADSNPNSASMFKSAGECIVRHAKRYLSQGFFDTKTDSRYFGTCPGDKMIGVCVKYASDPYHGEKIGGIAYLQDKKMGSKDFRKYTIGKTKKASYLYKSASKKSKKLLRLSNQGGKKPVGITVAIIGEKGDFYKVQSEMGIVNSKASYKNKYDFKTSVGYIPKKEITVISRAGTGLNEETEAAMRVPNIKGIRPFPSQGFTPGYMNSLRVSMECLNTSKSTVYYLYIYTAKNKACARIMYRPGKKGNINHVFFWNGKATTNNKAGFTKGQYVQRSSKGTVYRYRIISVNGKKKIYSKLFSTKIYSDCTKLNTDISKLSIKQKNKTVISMKPNRPGTSLIKIYNPKGKLVYYVKYQDKSMSSKLSTVFKTYGNIGSYKNKLLSKGKYTVKFTLGDYTYTYRQEITIR